MSRHSRRDVAGSRDMDKDERDPDYLFVLTLHNRNRHRKFLSHPLRSTCTVSSWSILFDGRDDVMGFFGHGEGLDLYS